MSAVGSGGGVVEPLIAACFDLRGAQYLPAVLPAGYVYLDADFAVHCPTCANLPDVRPFIRAADFVDRDDQCVVCGGL